TRSEGHILISVLAYQCVQMLRMKLREHGIHDSWNSLRTNLSSQQRITASFRQRNGYALHYPQSNDCGRWSATHIQRIAT
ncbi:MAG: hypothetical protein LBJ14_08785, partial [Desulfarculales bacterium]|nr:hypothetical protein [Desulfarculales bacterium]